MLINNNINKIKFIVFSCSNCRTKKVGEPGTKPFRAPVLDRLSYTDEGPADKGIVQQSAGYCVSWCLNDVYTK